MIRSLIQLIRSLVVLCRVLLFCCTEKKVWVEEEKKVQETRMFKIKSSLLALDPARLGPDHYYCGLESRQSRTGSRLSQWHPRTVT